MTNKYERLFEAGQIKNVVNITVIAVGSITPELTEADV